VYKNYFCVMLLRLENISFGYDNGKAIFDGFSLNLEQGRIMALIGESGCGKTTLLNTIYGLNDWNNGKVFFSGRELHGPKTALVPGEEDMKLVSQGFDLLPYSTVGDNVGKFISNVDLDFKIKHISELLEVVGMEKYVNEFPQNLSEGQKQRISIAKSLAQLPKLLLLDEPFSNLDFPRKVELRDKLFSYVKKQNISLIISTHDVGEVLPWVDEIAVLREGKLVQRGTTEEIFESPTDFYVAKLLGEVNLLPTEIQERMNLPKRIYFPYQIEFVDKNGVQAQIVESRFFGWGFRNLVDIEGFIIIVYSKEKKTGKHNVVFC